MKYGGLRRFSWRWWLALPFSLRDIYRRLSPPDGAVAGMSYWWHGTLERRPVERVFPASAGASYRILNAGRRDPGTSTTVFELNCVLMALNQAEARRVLEVGTFDGNTTLNLAANLPDDGRVVTLDLPIDDADPDLAIAVGEGLKNVTDRRIVGEQFKGAPEESRIRQVFGDTATLDWSTLGGPFDVAFIDGCHAYDYVIKDTENALSVVRPGGLVLWHDYAEMEPVSRAVDELSGRFASACAIQGTRIAVGFVKD